MPKSVDIDRAFTCIKNIVDSNRCGTCDKFEDLRRCACGGVVCENCASTGDCVACGILPSSSTYKPVIDELLTQKVQNAQVLLSTFGDAFKIDVYRRDRLSEKLKIEKQLFPECIQAPMKYSNKRKSLDDSYLKLKNKLKNKENRPFSYYFAEVSFREPKMEKSKYVQQWLNENNKISTPRMPFSNIPINEQSFSTISKTKPVNKVPFTLSKKKTKIRLKKNPNKLKHDVKQAVYKNKSESVIGKYLKIEDENRHSQMQQLKVYQSHVPNNIQDESGIELDDFIVIKDTPTEHIDKDELAYQAVLRAELNEHSDYASFINVEDISNDNISKEKDSYTKVPFILKSSLYKTCMDCNGDFINVKSNKDLSKYSKNVSITIVYNVKDCKGNFKQSSSAQTDLIEKAEISNLMNDNCFNGKSSEDLKICTHKETNNIPQASKDALETFESQDIFVEEGKSCNKLQKYLDQASDQNKSLSQNRLKQIIIDESESDSDLEQGSLHVTAEVHRSCQPEDYDVLSDLPLVELGTRKRHAVRGATPDSNNSSEKENFDPNRTKKRKYVKKSIKKDKVKYNI